MGVMKGHSQSALMLCFLCLGIVCFCNGDGSICRELERKALVDFKQGLKDPGGHLLSWIGYDCCSWTGVQCHNHTGHVIRLDLHRFDFHSWPLEGEIRSSLLVLNHLRYLDLSMNYFNDNIIPAFLGSLVSLQYLNLSYAGFSGRVPHQLGNLSSLHYLDLSGNTLDLIGGHFLTNISSLQYLNLNSLNLSKAPNLLKSLNTLHLISEIHLSECELHVPLSLGEHINFTDLRFLDLSDNAMNSTIPLWLLKLSGLEKLYLGGNSLQDLSHYAIGNLSSLRVLDLKDNGILSAGLPTTLGKLCKLTILYLSGNEYFSTDLNGLGGIFSGCIKSSLKELYWTDAKLSGQLPSWLGNLKSLKTLDLSYNSFYGSLVQLQLPSLQELSLSYNKLNGIPKYLGQLFPNLVILDLSHNNLSSNLMEAHFSGLTKLKSLDISSNEFELVVPPEWVPPPKLKYLHMSDCKLGPKFPSWLQKLKYISGIKMSNASIVDSLPVWFWNFSINIQDVDLSHNEIRGKLPAGSSNLPNLRVLDLSHNYLEGRLPQFSSKLLDFHPSFSSSIFSNTSMIVPSLSVLYISSNKITGGLPTSLCELKYLEILDLSHNMIQGVVPDCWNHSLYSLLQVMDLSHNNLSGIIPASIGSKRSLEILHLNNNGFSGELPFSFKNCIYMSNLDLGHNKISGSIPTWLADFEQLDTVELQHNMLNGTIPPQLGNLTYLKVIDISNNHLSGAIPHSFGNFMSMKTNFEEGFSGIGDYENNIEINVKGREVHFERLSWLLVCIDLSNNMLSGEIPEELAHLALLQSLNLSHNQLSGKLSEKIGGLRWLEVLDLSMNNLSGVLPPSMTSLTSLNHLNLSYNKFYGKIPYGGQLQVLPDKTIYSGNQGLCGFPLDIKCEIEAPAQQPSLPNSEDDDNLESIWFYLSMSLGFIFGFWAISCALIFKKSWRYAYFRFVDHIYNKIFVIVVVNLTKINI